MGEGCGKRERGGGGKEVPCDCGIEDWLLPNSHAGVGKRSVKREDERVWRGV